MAKSKARKTAASATVAKQEAVETSKNETMENAVSNVGRTPDEDPEMNHVVGAVDDEVKVITEDEAKNEGPIATEAGGGQVFAGDLHTNEEQIALTGSSQQYVMGVAVTDEAGDPLPETEVVDPNSLDDDVDVVGTGTFATDEAGAPVRTMNPAGMGGYETGLVANAFYDNLYPADYVELDNDRIQFTEVVYYQFMYPGSTRVGKAIAYPAGTTVSSSILEKMTADDNVLPAENPNHPENENAGGNATV